MKVWDVSIIETELERFYDSELGEFIDAIQQNITVCHYYASKYSLLVITIARNCTFKVSYFSSIFSPANRKYGLKMSKNGRTAIRITSHVHRCMFHSQLLVG